MVAEKREVKITTESLISSNPPHREKRQNVMDTARWMFTLHPPGLVHYTADT